MRPRLHDDSQMILLTTLLLQVGIYEFNGAIPINTDTADNKFKGKQKVSDRRHSLKQYYIMISFVLFKNPSVHRFLHAL